MTFIEPWRLLLLLGVLALAVGYVVMQRRRRRYAVRFAALPLLDRVAPRGPGWKRHLPAAAYLLMAATLVTAFARPEAQTQVPREQATVVVALDVSNSMQAQDVSPDRLTVAREAAATFVEDLPKQYRVGLVTFASTAQVAVMPTTDRAQVQDALERVRLGGGTAIGSALLAAVQSVGGASGQDSGTGSGSDSGAGALPDSGSPADDRVPARIVLLSDGMSSAGAPIEQAVAAATEAGIPVSTIAYGTQDGTVVLRGETIPVPADTATLRQIASQTGGQAYTAASAGELEKVYEDLGSSIGYRLEHTEITSWFVGAALVLALLAAMGSLLVFGQLP